MIKSKLYRIVLSVLVALTITITGVCQKAEVSEELPNILWITSEDNSPYFVGCYGNSLATTPNIDKLANQGL